MFVAMAPRSKSKISRPPHSPIGVRNRSMFSWLFRVSRTSAIAKTFHRFKKQAYLLHDLFDLCSHGPEFFFPLSDEIRRCHRTCIKKAAPPRLAIPLIKL
jgi:hypothetical protein